MEWWSRGCLVEKGTSEVEHAESSVLIRAMKRQTFSSNFPTPETRDLGAEIGSGPNE